MSPIERTLCLAAVLILCVACTVCSFTTAIVFRCDGPRSEVRHWAVLTAFCLFAAATIAFVMGAAR